MENALLVGLSRQVALSRELDVVANNIANINTNGFKADGALFEEYLSNGARTNALSGADSRVSFVRDRGTWHDMSKGPVEQTGNPLDVAINGDGFFVVQTPRGERYTRSGALQIDAKGTLVTSEGFPVMGGSGPITLQASDRDIYISKDGAISVHEGKSIQDSLRGNLKIVRFQQKDEERLRKDSGGSFMAPNGVTPEADSKSRVVQGALEKSNVRGVVEIARMIEITRSYTQVATMLQQQGDLRSNAINKLADVPA